MFATPEQLSNANKITTETVQSLFNSFFNTIERISALNLNASRSVIEDTMLNTRNLLNIKDVQEALNLLPLAGPAALDKFTGYSREVYEIINKAQHDVSGALEKQASEYNSNFSDLLVKAAQNAPAGSEVAVAAVKSAIAAANSAYDSMQKAGKQVVGFVEANLAATAKAVDSATATTTSAVTGSKKKVA